MPLNGRRFRIYGQSAAGWAAANEILKSNEIALETDTKLGKLGNGATKYNNLPYELFGGSGGRFAYSSIPIAAASTLVPPANVFHVEDGEPIINAITAFYSDVNNTAIPNGTLLTMIFDNLIATTTISNGGNIRTAGGAIVATTGDTLTLVKQGGLWREVGRAVI